MLWHLFLCVPSALWCARLQGKDPLQAALLLSAEQLLLYHSESLLSLKMKGKKNPSCGDQPVKFAFYLWENNSAGSMGHRFTGCPGSTGE